MAYGLARDARQCVLILCDGSVTYVSVLIRSVAVEGFIKWAVLSVKRQGA